MNKSELLTMHDICELLRRTRRAVYKVMARYPDFPQPVNKRQQGGRMYFDKQTFIAWYESHKDELDYQLRFKHNGVKDE